MNVDGLPLPLGIVFAVIMIAGVVAGVLLLWMKWKGGK